LRRYDWRLWSCRHEFLFRQWQRVKEGLQRGLAEAPAALMGALLVVFGDPGIKVDRKLNEKFLSVFT